MNDLSHKLKSKGIQLIVLPCPDKYDIYHDYITNRQYPKPMFFEYLNRMSKEYFYVNSKTILTNAIKQQKDIYFYDDTHWSPWASELIANDIFKLVKSDE